jgi:DNA-binding response OmpR family regulator
MNILIVDDEAEFRSLVTESLSEEGYKVQALENGELIFSQVTTPPDIILLDLSLPGKSGLQILKELKSNLTYKNVPVIMVTGHNDDQNVVQALNLGADDYITKPFRFNVLDARIKAVLRRAKERVAEGIPAKLVFQSLTINTATHQTLLNNVEIKFTLTEFKILAELVRRQGQVVTREQLRDSVLQQPNLSDRTLDVHMTAVRKKLAELGKFVITIRGLGYRLSTENPT